MISPLGQRQMFQTINAEAVKAALDVSWQVQRETGQKQVVADRMAEDQVSVPEIPQANGLKTEERQNHEQGQKQHHGSTEDGTEAQEEAPGPLEANPAGPHMDFLA